MIPDWYPGDLLLTDTKYSAKAGRIIAGFYDGEPIARRLVRDGKKMLIVASNRNFPRSPLRRIAGIIRASSFMRFVSYLVDIPGSRRRELLHELGLSSSWRPGTHQCCQTAWPFSLSLIARASSSLQASS